jgi:hypothetical protein
MSYNGWERSSAHSGREVRAAQKRQRELERLLREQAKLEAKEAAKLDVEAFENSIEVLVSVHKEMGPNWDWHSVAAALISPSPGKLTFNETKARQTVLILGKADGSSGEQFIAEARKSDEEAFREASRSHLAAESAILKRAEIAHRILRGDARAYLQAIQEFRARRFVFPWQGSPAGMA